MAPPSASEDARVRDRLRGGRYGLVLILVGTSLVFQMSAAASVVRAAATVAVAAAVAALVLWLVRGDIPRAPAAIANGLLILVAPPVIAAAGRLATSRTSSTSAS